MKKKKKSGWGSRDEKGGLRDAISPNEAAA